MIVAGGAYKGHMARAVWVYGCTGQISDLWVLEAFSSQGLVQCSDPEAHDSTSDPAPSGHTGFLLFLRGTKPVPAQGPSLSWNVFPHILAWLP